MSRSYKKTPIVKDRTKGRKFSKRQANKAVRREKELVNGKQFRKVYNTWNIYDYVNYCSLDDFMQIERLRQYYPSDEEMKQAWRRDFYLK